MQVQVETALVKGLAVLGDDQDGLDHVVQHIHHQTDQGDQGQGQAHDGRTVHDADNALHLGLAGGLGVPQQGDHLVQLAHQNRQIALDLVLVVAPGLLGIGLQQVQHVDGGLVELLVQGLHLAAQLQDGGIVRVCRAIDPLAQHTGVRRRAAGELRAGVQRVAEIAGPLVVGGLRLMAAGQQGRSLLIGSLCPVHADDADGDHHAEQQHGEQRAGHPDPYASVDTLTHGVPLFFLIRPERRRPSRGGAPRAVPRQRRTEKL